MGEITKCIDCDNLHGSAREKSALARPEYWLCSAHPRMSYVHGSEPFMRCRGINGGRCPMFKAIPLPPVEGPPPAPEPIETRPSPTATTMADEMEDAVAQEIAADPARQGPLDEPKFTDPHPTPPLEPAKEAPAEEPFSTAEEPPTWSVLSAKVLGQASGATSEAQRREAWNNNIAELHQLKVDYPEEYARLFDAIRAMNEEMKAGDPPF